MSMYVLFLGSFVFACLVSGIASFFDKNRHIRNVIIILIMIFATLLFPDEVDEFLFKVIWQDMLILFAGYAAGVIVCEMIIAKKAKATESVVS